ncbi:hypothetical protein AVEN_264405-1 [Araneus ventricosus]|uniref:Uncharacterized protein n=1 Tax=Araneus ventricosus TaxID=182803 RepID=A0A4Y2N0V1_ARAVE|nr:hypothetical protein AVEN_264405-1 [Araneus ventricosus]
MSGRAYSKDLRAHFLTFIILYEKLYKNSLLQLNEETKSIVKVSFNEFMATNKKSIEDCQGYIGIKQLIDVVERSAEEGNFPRTARLCFTPNVPVYIFKKWKK